MAIPYTVTDVDINRVSESFVQSNAQNFAVASSIPKALCLDRYSGRSNTTSYDLAALENSLVAADVSDWSPGVDPPGPLQLAETSVSFSRAGKAVLDDTYLRPSTFGQLLSSRPIAYLPSVARTCSRPVPPHLFPSRDTASFFPQRSASGS